jgi:hypothetical protein
LGYPLPEGNSVALTWSGVVASRPFHSGGQRHRCEPLRLALLRAVEEDDQFVDDGFSVRLRRDIGGDQLLGLDADRRVGDNASFKPILRVLSSRLPIKSL